ncbi:Cas9 inhibitor AcrIIA9 family protein [Paenibacillus amylolyticus]|uniref:Cas9 inhibitor AcrIIA9 family protein n=1 Tax=Paenibacillus amylolyticus TaxID=1451 RepID=UPI0009F82091|nr:Cas9 inhibitor AcrIIA9 family protein [Paenibacillus amylolyticus]
MSNHRWLNRQEAQNCGIPVFVPREEEINGEWIMGGRWNMPRPIGDILLTYSRCAALGTPVPDFEQPAGYCYKRNAKDQYKYVPLFSRAMEELDLDKIDPAEKRSIEVRQTYAGYGLRRVIKPGAVLICLSCGQDMTKFINNHHTCPYCGLGGEQLTISKRIVVDYELRGDMNVEEAIAKLKAEMDGTGTNAYIKLIGDFLIKHIQANPGSAEQVMAADKTIAKSLLAMQAEAKKKAVGGMAMLTDEEGFAIVLNYFGLQGAPAAAPPPEEPKAARFDVKLDDFL